MARFAALLRSFMLCQLAATATAAAVGTYARLLSYAAQLELGGVIPSCISFDDRQWLVLAQSTRAEVQKVVDERLAEFRGEDLFLNGYDVAGEAKIRAARENGQKPAAPGRTRGRPPKTQGKPNGKPRENPGEKPEKSQAKPRENPSSLSDPLSNSVSDPPSNVFTGDQERGETRADITNDVDRVLAECIGLWNDRYRGCEMAEKDRRDLRRSIVARPGDVVAIPKAVAIYLATNRKDGHPLRWFAKDIGTYLAGVKNGRNGAVGQAPPATEYPEDLDARLV